jgi:perosamine synthetase
VIIPLSQPDITQLEIDAVVSVLKSPQLSLGARLEEFETRIISYIGTKHAIAVSSGTAGLHLCIRALGIGQDDEVIVPSFTFIAAANAIRYEGGVPVFVDIEASTLNVQPACIEAAITAKTKAIMVVHTFGRPAGMLAILQIAKRHNLYVIEDACEAIGAEIDGQMIGSFGDAAVFAFYPNKQITTGEGGMIVTQNDHLALEMRAMRNQGRYPSDAWLQHSVLGFNYRLSEMNCALGCAQMERIAAILLKREAAANLYRKALSAIPGVIVPSDADAGARISWFVYVIRLVGTEPRLRDQIVDALQAAGIQCGRYFAPIHQQPAYRNWPLPLPLPVTEAESLRTIALPFFSNISSEQIATVAQALETALLSE